MNVKKTLSFVLALAMMKTAASSVFADTESIAAQAAVPVAESAVSEASEESAPVEVTEESVPAETSEENAPAEVTEESTPVEAEVTQEAVGDTESIDDIIAKTAEISRKLDFDGVGTYGAEITDEEAQILDRAIGYVTGQAETDGLDVESAVYLSASNCEHGFYYDQLSADKQALYDTLGDVCETYLNSGTDTTESSGWFASVAIDLNKTNQVDVSQVFQLFFHSNPRYFFLKPVWAMNTNSGSLRLYLASYDNCRKASDRQSLKNSIDSLTSTWLTEVNKCSSPVEKAYKIIELIAQKTTYDTNYESYQSILAPMYFGRSVCTGYALTFSYLCSKVGIETIIVTSADHAWNRVRFGDKWFETDPTWFDTMGFDSSFVNRSTASMLAIDQYNNHVVETAAQNNMYMGITLPDCPDDYKPGDDGAVSTSGKCGDDLRWEFADGTLTITGTGDMYDYETAPWSSYASQITSIVLPDGLTGIGSNSFSGCAVTSVTLPDVSYIANYAFANTKLTSLDIPAGAVLGTNAFYGCPLTHIHLPYGSNIYSYAGRYGLPSYTGYFHVLSADGLCDDVSCPHSAAALKKATVSFAVQGVFGGRNVTFNSAVNGAEIYYAAGTSALTTSNAHVMAGETVLIEDLYGTLYARTYYKGIWGTPCRLILKIPNINTPTINITGNTAEITTTTPLCYIVYTTDGTEPTPDHGTRVYNKAEVDITGVPVLRARAIRSCFTNSEIAEKVFSTNLEAPKFAVKGVFGGRNVTFNCNYGTADIYYSTTTSNIKLTDAHVKAGETILFEDFYGTLYAKAYLNGQWSNVSKLILKIPVVAKPTASISNGYIILTTATPDSYIVYTLDGTAPTVENGVITNGTRGKAPLAVPGRSGMIFRVIAVRSAFTNSEEISFGTR